jgi:hypothetical protein
LSPAEAVGDSASTASAAVRTSTIVLRIPVSFRFAAYRRENWWRAPWFNDTTRFAVGPFSISVTMPKFLR